MGRLSLKGLVGGLTRTLHLRVSDSELPVPFPPGPFPQYMALLPLPSCAWPPLRALPLEPQRVCLREGWLGLDRGKGECGFYTRVTCLFPMYYCPLPPCTVATQAGHSPQGPIWSLWGAEQHPCTLLVNARRSPRPNDHRCP